MSSREAALAWVSATSSVSAGNGVVGKDDGSWAGASEWARMFRSATAWLKVGAFRGAPSGQGEPMTVFKKLLGAYLMGTAVFVAAWFVVNPFFAVSGVWDVANYLMAVSLVAALVFNVRRKLKEEGKRDDCDGLRRWEADLRLYLTAGVTMLFFRNWFLEIAGADGDGSTTGLVWIAVNVLFPLAAGATGLTLWREPAGR